MQALENVTTAGIFVFEYANQSGFHSRGIVPAKRERDGGNRVAR